MDDKEKLNIDSQTEPYEKKKCFDADIQIELLKQVLALREQVSELKAEILKLQLLNDDDKEIDDIQNEYEVDDGIEDDDYDDDEHEAAAEKVEVKAKTKNDKKVKKKENNDKNVKKTRKRFWWIGETIFYILLVALVLTTFFLRSNADGKPTVFAGFSAFVVETGSMESEIPKGSLVITKRIDAEQLEIGDDITFMSNPTTTVTHRIIGITENFSETGKRGFETQGVMNKHPDKNIVPADNVVGKVVFHSEVLGTIANFISANWPFLIFAIVIIVALYITLKRVLR